MNITIVILKEKSRCIEISARKFHLSALILSLKVTSKLFFNKTIGFHYYFKNFNDYLMKYRLVKGIFSDSNNIFLWY